MTDNKKVTSVTFTMRFAGGGRRVAEFLRAEKVEDLMSDNGSLGEFLRDMAKQQRRR